MKEKPVHKHFKLPPHVAEKLHRDASTLGVNQTAYIIMLIAQGMRK